MTFMEKGSDDDSIVRNWIYDLYGLLVENDVDIVGNVDAIEIVESLIRYA
ncbi:hypothetical protein H4683_000041 [Filibacter limicola]|uniref:Uncharacterized protein n=1 Tax=Sporosarcina limicola TaxID=34101 RepID=A0A927MH71_9BACL|nr:hypothetical protein [Sporosarcina limicola]